MKPWNRLYDCCQGCGTTDRKFFGHGYCERCHTLRFGKFQGELGKYHAVGGELDHMSCGRRSRLNACAAAVESHSYRDLLSPETKKRLEVWEHEVQTRHE